MTYETKFITINPETKMFDWIVIINGQSFNYSMGFAHFSLKSNSGSNILDISKLDKNIKRELMKAANPFKKIYFDELERFNGIYLNIPELNDVLKSLFMDSQEGRQTFSEFCSDFGYDSDSIKALEIYHACQKNYEKLKKALSQDYEVEKTRIESLDL